MRLLYINSQPVDIDETTSIGIDYQAYDLKEPSKRKVNVSNTFSIPKTVKNLAILGYPDNPQSTSDIIYDLITCDYWLDNNHIVDNGIVRIEDISDRVNLYLTNKNSLWDRLKLFSWASFVPEYLAWLRDVKGVVTEQLGDDNLTTFMANYTSATEHLVVPFYYGNNLNSTVESETTTKIILSEVINLLPAWGYSYSSLIGGGHFCAYSKSIFEFLEYKFTVNFCTQEVSLTGNIWDDAIAPMLYTPLRNLCVIPQTTYAPLTITGYKLLDYYYEYFQTFIPIFTPLEDVKDKDDKTMFDYVLSFLMKFNAIVDEINLSDGTKALRIARFDDIKTLAPVIDFSKKIQSISSFKPSISGYSQNNYIKVKGLYPEASDTIGSRIITCLNKNLEVKSDLFSIDEYFANFKSVTTAVIPDLSIQESFKTFEFFISNGTSADSITLKVKFNNNHTEYLEKTCTANLFIPAHYSLDNEYLFLEEIIQKPKIYTIKKYLSINDIFNLKFFAQYFIKELNGSFYINKISGFNPQKSNEPTTIEVIRISNKTPYPLDEEPYVPGEGNYYVDGLGNIFVDGNGNAFY